MEPSGESTARIRYLDGPVMRLRRSERGLSVRFRWVIRRVSGASMLSIRFFFGLGMVGDRLRESSSMCRRAQTERSGDSTTRGRYLGGPAVPLHPSEMEGLNRFQWAVVRKVRLSRSERSKRLGSALSGTRRPLGSEYRRWWHFAPAAQFGQDNWFYARVRSRSTISSARLLQIGKSAHRVQLRVGSQSSAGG